ncbi:amidohydrolase family protein [Pseudomonas typographi]|uniref:Amidohydrolase family protein n=1 Tax=Pseudomonas typographi TaxID=2715964 RepID=A0ABR7Z1A4_9PSED|nr:amidohydrolase family protein [Pseudomonas typographi]MBD1599167.1 amidohydrolase family protein [Pseudomonas typographi]
MPSFALVDAHVHYYDPSQLNYPWLDNVPAIKGTYLPADFAAATEGIAIDKQVFVEVDVAPGQELAEARFVQGLARSDRRIQGIVASAAIERGAWVNDELDRLGEVALLKGVRRLIQYHEAVDYCLQPAFVEGVQQLGRRGLSFDICIRHQQLASATELVRRCPDVQFVLDHIAKPGIANGVRHPWWEEIKTIAQLPNVVCKVTGVITEADPLHWTLCDIRPYIDHTLDCFGLGRALFASDWPVINLAGAYRPWVAVMDELLSGCSASELQQFYRDTAIATYRL